MRDVIKSESDERVANNAVRHQYRVLSDAEKADLLAILDGLGQSRELSIARTKIEEAAMWAVKHITK